MTPEKMAVIINIQMLLEKIGDPDSFCFDVLEILSIEGLRAMQADLIIEYNKTI